MKGNLVNAIERSMSLFMLLGIRLQLLQNQYLRMVPFLKLYHFERCESHSLIAWSLWVANNTKGHRIVLLKHFHSYKN